MGKWSECLIAEQNIDGSSHTLGQKVRCSLNVRPAANGHLAVTLVKLTAARKGTGHPTSLRQQLRINALFNSQSPTYGILYGTNLYHFTYVQINKYK